MPHWRSAEVVHTTTQGEVPLSAANLPGDALFILLGAIMVLAMHSGFAFLELGTVRSKNQVNALVKILADFSVSTIAYFFIGFWSPTASTFFAGAEALAQRSGYELVKFFFLLTFAAAIPAIVSGGIAERATLQPATRRVVPAGRLRLSFLRRHRVERRVRYPRMAESARFGAEFHDFAGSVVVHAVGGWVGLVAVLLLGARSRTLHQGRQHRSAIRRRAFRSLRSAHGSCRSAGSAST